MTERNRPRDSTEYLLGQIVTRIDKQNGAVDEVKKSLNGLSDKVSGLPCVVHEGQIKAIIDKLKEADNIKIRNSLTKRDYIVGLSAAFITGLFYVIAVLIARGIIWNGEMP